MSATECISQAVERETGGTRRHPAAPSGTAGPAPAGERQRADGPSPLELLHAVLRLPATELDGPPVRANAPSSCAARKAVLERIVDHADRGVWALRVDTIASETGHSDRTVRRALDCLCADGWVIRERCYRDDGSQSVYAYRVNVERIMRAAAARTDRRRRQRPVTMTGRGGQDDRTPPVTMTAHQEALELGGPTQEAPQRAPGRDDEHEQDHETSEGGASPTGDPTPPLADEPVEGESPSDDEGVDPELVEYTQRFVAELASRLRVPVEEALADPVGNDVLRAWRGGVGAKRLARAVTEMMRIPDHVGDAMALLRVRVSTVVGDLVGPAESTPPSPPSPTIVTQAESEPDAATEADSDELDELDQAEVDEGEAAPSPEAIQAQLDALPECERTALYHEARAQLAAEWSVREGQLRTDGGMAKHRARQLYRERVGVDA